MISEWIRDEYSNRIIGIVVADIVDDNTFNVDYSVCSPVDTFNRDFGRKIAMNRCKFAYNRDKRINSRISPNARIQFFAMVERATRYFKHAAPSKRVLAAVARYGYLKCMGTGNFVLEKDNFDE